jgi:hypothetical protein
VGGERAKARSRFDVWSLEERKIPRGAWRSAGFNRSVAVVTLTVGSKALESRAVALEPSSDRQAWRRKRQEGTGRGQPGTALRCDRTPEGKTLYVVVGRNKPTRHVVEKTVEGGWNAEDGT